MGGVETVLYSRAFKEESGLDKQLQSGLAHHRRGKRGIYGVVQVIVQRWTKSELAVIDS